MRMKSAKEHGRGPLGQERAAEIPQVLPGEDTKK